MIDIHKQEMEVIKKGSADTKFRNKTRHVCEVDNWYLDKDSPLKKSCHQIEIYEDLIVTSDHIKFKGKLLHVVWRIWQELDSKDRDFVVSYDRKVEDNESTYGIYVPANFRESIQG